MSIVLKRYQEKTLNVIGDFFAKTHEGTIEDAFKAVVSSGDLPQRLKGVRPYSPNADAPLVPQVTVKVPTGGGKTILAAHAIKLIAEADGIQYPFVLWFTPSETIRVQTAEALKKPWHPYRKELDKAFGGNVKVFDIDEKFLIRPSDISDNACIVVTTAQAFRHQEHDKYKVYKSHEDLEEHFADVPLMDGMEAEESDPKKPKMSFANLVVMHSPIMIVDEAHTMLSTLSKETIAGLRPCAVLELTATPADAQNILYSVRAGELYDEEMVKLPIELTHFQYNWQNCVLAAMAKRDELQKIADKETAQNPAKYLRPLVLFQASNKSGETPIAELKAFLTTTGKAEEKEIAIVTGEQKELDGVDVNSPQCPIKYVITVQALKEGWDCPSAYVLCSVANVHNNKDTIQLLGRVMRQPQATRRSSAELNRAYAFVLSQSFKDAAEDLVDGLKSKGFDGDEALGAIKPIFPAQLPNFDDPDEVELPEGEIGVEIETVLPRTVEVKTYDNGKRKIVVPQNIAPVVQAAVVAVLTKAGAEDKANEFVLKAAKRRASADESAPSKSLSISIPRLKAEVQGEFVYDVDGAFGEVGCDIEEELPPRFEDDDFKIVSTDGRKAELFLEKGKITYRQSVMAQQIFLSGFSGRITESDMINELDALTPFPYIRPERKRGWIVGIVNDLLLVKKYTSDQLFCYRYQLKRCLDGMLREALVKSRCKAYQMVFARGGQYATSLDFDNGFSLNDELYRSSVFKYYPGGDYAFTKHFLGPNRIPAFDGRRSNGEGEEYECAKAIDLHPAVKFWLRNADSNMESFRLPVSGGWFYPDFVGQLNDGRMFVVEYKGEQLLTNKDTAEKTAVGELWASLDKNCLYATVSQGKTVGSTVEEQLNKLFGS